MTTSPQSVGSPDNPRSLDHYFTARGWTPMPYQRDTWAAYAAGHSGLVHAPTGTGKTLAVWGGPLAEGLAVPNRRDDDDNAQPEPLRVLWITPLRALANDTRDSLCAPVEHFGLNWSVEIRHGDTSSTQRARQRMRLPTVLLTTPESLSLLLTYSDSRTRLRTLRAVIVDEWHELLGNKRGVQVELALARLRAWNPNLRTWGLSASLGNLEQARDVLLGNSSAHGVLIQGRVPRELKVETLLPDDMERFPWVGHIGTRMVEPVARRIDKVNTALVFTNTRSQCEIWHAALQRARPAWVDRLGLHHGSLDRDLRREVERGLDTGALKAVVCTSSLDLGVDFAPVDLVVQVGSPKGVGRLLQRAGRSGHAPGRVSHVLGVPTHALELVEFAAVREALQEQRIEAREPVTLALDVLLQHLVTLALGGGLDPEEAFAEVRQTHAYRTLSRDDFAWLVAFVTTGGTALTAYPEYQRLQKMDTGRLGPANRRVAQWHRLGIGTIASDSEVTVRYTTGGTLGTIEEGFLARLKPGDVFAFAGRTLELVRFRELTAYVRKARKGRRNVPSWAGGRMPISSALARAMERKVARADEAADPEIDAVASLLDIQRRWSALPGPDRFLIEQVRVRGAHHTFVYPFAGRLVHEGLATLTGWRLAQIRPVSLRIAANDYGFALHSSHPLDLDEAIVATLLDEANLVDDLLAGLNATELARRQFREIARVAGLIIPGYPGRRKSTRQLQVSSGLLYDVFRRYDPDNLLLAQARREILARQLEFTRLRDALAVLRAREFVLVRPPRLTPFAFPLWVDSLSNSEISTETLNDRLQRMLASLEKAADASG